MTMKDIFVRLRGDNSDLNRALLGSAAASKVLGKNLDDADDSSRRLSDSLNTSNDRTTMLIQSALALGPALVPIGAQAVPILMGLATQMTFAAGAAGTLGLAFSGIGKTLKAVNEYAIDPSAANFQKMHEELNKLGPAGRDFVMYLQELRPQLQGLQDIAQEGILPGAQEGIEHMMTLLPQVERIIENIADTLGSAMAEGGANLAGPGWTEFFDYMENEAQPILSDMAHTMGNFMQGFANMIVAFGPLTRNFSGGFLEMSRNFNDWADGLESSDSFQKFADYVTETGPAVVDVLGALSSMLLALVEAAAPVGKVALPIIEALADALSAILRSPAGPVLVAAAAGLSAVARAVALYKAANGLAIGSMMEKVNKEGAKASAASFAAAGGYQRMAAGAAILALAMTDVDEQMGLSNTAMYTLLGTMVAPGWGTAAGLIVGGFLDIKAAADESRDAAQSAYDAIATGTRQTLLDRKAMLEAALADPGMFDDTGAMANALKAVNQALRGGKGPADLMAGAIGKTGDQAREAADDIQALSVQLSILAGFFDRRASIRAYQESLDALGAGLRDGAKDWRVSTKAGRENLDLLDANATAILQVAEKLKDKKARITFLQDAREQLVAFREQFPASAKAINRVLRELDAKLDGFAKPRKPPKLDADPKPAERAIRRGQKMLDEYASQRPTPKIDADDKPAKAKINSTERLLGDLIGQPWTANIKVTSNAAQVAAETNRILNGLDDEIVYIHTVRTGPGGQGAGYDSSAYGNIYGPARHYAYGDVRDRHQPELAGPGLSRVWREPETQGESYIPHANDNRRPRAKAILEQTAGMFGGAVVWNAVGNMLRSQQTLVPARGGAGGAQVLALGDLRVSGTLDTPWGPAQVDGIARAAARDEASADRRFATGHVRGYPNG